MITECKLDDKSSAENISASIVAVFTVSVEDEEIVKAVWEKSMKHQELSNHIAKLHKTSQIMSQVSTEKPAIKQEPIGRGKRKRERDKEEKKTRIVHKKWRNVVGTTYGKMHSE